MVEVQIKEVDPVVVMSLSFSGPYEQTRDRLDDLTSWLLRVGHPYSGPPMGLYYDDPTQVAPEDLRAEVCLPIAEKCEGDEPYQRKELPAVTVASVIHTGPLSGLREVFPELFAWIAENGYRFVEGTPVREVFQNVYGGETAPEELIVEVQVPVEPVSEPSPEVQVPVEQVLEQTEPPQADTDPEEPVE